VSSPKPDFDLIWNRRPVTATERQPPLSQQQIVATAVALADESGLDAVSIRRIAARLNVGATTLYWHVQSKSDLYELMFDAGFGELEYPEPSGDWRADIRLCSLRVHDLMNRHPWLVLLGIQPTMGPNIRRFSEFAAAVLGPLGLDVVTRTEIFAIVNNYLLGFAHRRTAWNALRERAGLTDDQWHSRLDEYLDETRSANPGLAADIEARLRLTSEQSFELGLDCMLDGITARLVPGSRRNNPPE
jgi:AcrR family transcriptional regulator